MQRNIGVILLSLVCAVALFSCSGSTDDELVRTFIDDRVKELEPKLKAVNLASWNALATGEKHFYDEQAAFELQISKIYSNRQAFENLKKWAAPGAVRDSLLRRQVTLLYNNYLEKQVDTVLMSQIVEKAATIAGVFNNFRATVDGKEFSDNEIEAVLNSETNSARRQRVWEASKDVGKAVAPMILELVKLRNQAAKQVGFDNYYVMALALAEQRQDEIAAVFDELKSVTDAPFKKLKDDIDAKLSQKYGISMDKLRPWHYEDRYFLKAPQVGTLDLDKFFRGKKIDELGRAFYSNIGLPVDDVLKQSDIYGRKGKYQHAMEYDIDRNGDIRVMLSVTDDSRWMGTMLHELGHAVYDKYLRNDLPYFLRTVSHSFLTEAIAKIMQRQSDNADWLQAMVGISNGEKETIRSFGEESLRRTLLMRCRFGQVMMRFERAMYQNPDQDLNKLWWDLVREYQLVTPPEGRNAPDWAAQIHLGQYPVYYHNYQLGELAASQLQNFISRTILKTEKVGMVSFANRPAVGDYLKSRFFAPGASLRWDDLMKHATEEPLSARYFAAECVGKGL